MEDLKEFSYQLEGAYLLLMLEKHSFTLLSNQNSKIYHHAS